MGRRGVYRRLTMGALESLYGEFGFWILLGVVIAALITSTIHGTVGVAGGTLMAAALALLIGVKPVVPVMSVALVVSHFSRTMLNVRTIDWRALAIVMAGATPMIVVGALVYGMLPGRAIAVVLGILILAAIPLRHWAHSRQIKAGSTTLGAVGGVFGFLAGGSIGSGMLLTPFLLGYGMSKEAFVGTMALIAFITNAIRMATFGGSQLLDAHYAFMGFMVGLAMIPGNWIGRTILRRMAPGTHSRLIDLFALLAGLDFLYLAFR
jgi:uncharacterized membrane protein YfcA